jgi:hypothetical protein
MNMKTHAYIIALFIPVALMVGCTITPSREITQSNTSTPVIKQATRTPSFTPVILNNAPFPGTVILGRPTIDSITMSLLTTAESEFFIQYGKNPGQYDALTDIAALKKDEPGELTVKGLEKDSQYYYRICHRTASETGFSAGTEGSFHTQRAVGESFVFTIDADPHFDSNTDSEKLQLTFQNMLKEHPDFNIDLGDTFMSEKLVLQSNAQVASNYANKRDYFGIFGSSVPLYLAIGNHDGEAGGALNGTENNMAVWASKARQLYYLNPSPDDFYSGDSKEAPFIGLRGNYYAWQWGDALFVVLDPYWYSSGVKGLSGWDVSLGKEQYDWLKSTLETSNAKFKFVFAHNLIGGADMGTSGKSRGGVEAAPYYEWGGKNADGTWGFDQYRLGWGKPIHQILVDNHVTIFFHGHDHFFAMQDLDGVIYQECPQPGAKNDKNSASNYGYINGVFMSSPGHLRISVTQNEVTVDYIKTYLPTETAHSNGEIAYTYTISR